MPGFNPVARMEAEDFWTYVARTLTASPLNAEDIWTYADRVLTVEKGIERSSTPEISNVTMTNADTEYEHTFETGCRKFLLHTRDGTVFRLAFVTGKVATPTEPYFTVPANQSYYEDFVDLAEGTKIYLGCAEAGKIVEILEWK